MWLVTFFKIFGLLSLITTILFTIGFGVHSIYQWNAPLGIVVGVASVLVALSSLITAAMFIDDKWG